MIRATCWKSPRWSKKSAGFPALFVKFIDFANLSLAGRWRAAQHLSKAAPLFRAQVFEGAFNGLRELFAHLRTQLIDLGFLTVQGCFIKGLRAEQLNRLVLGLAHLLGKRIRSAASLLESFAEPLLRRFRQLFAHLFPALLA